MDQLERGCCRKELFGLVAKALTCGQAQHRPDALASGQQRISHRLDQTFGARDVVLRVGFAWPKVERLEQRLDEHA